MLWKIFTFTSSTFSEGLFHCEGCFFKCLLRKKKTILTSPPPTRPLCGNLSQPASPACTRSPPQQFSGGKAEGRHRKQGKNKEKNKQEEKSRFKKWWPRSVHSHLRLSAQSEAGCEEMPESKDVPAAPAAWLLPGIPAAVSLNKQIPGTDKENEVQGQWRVKEDKRIKGKMLE